MNDLLFVDFFRYIFEFDSQVVVNLNVDIIQAIAKKRDPAIEQLCASVRVPKRSNIWECVKII